MPPRSAYNAVSVGSGDPPVAEARKPCRYCGEPFTSSRPDAAFCRPEHRKAYHGRIQERAHEAYPVLIGWRKRPRDPHALRTLGRMVDRWLREDRITKGGDHG